jgi:hypothetical protein
MDKWEQVNFVGNIYNRLVVYRGSMYHRSVLPGFGTDKYTGRLFQTFFFDTENKWTVIGNGTKKTLIGITIQHLSSLMFSM